MDNVSFEELVVTRINEKYPDFDLFGILSYYASRMMDEADFDLEIALDADIRYMVVGSKEMRGEAITPEEAADFSTYIDPARLVMWLINRGIDVDNTEFFRFRDRDEKSQRAFRVRKALEQVYRTKLHVRNDMVERGTIESWAQIQYLSALIQGQPGDNAEWQAAAFVNFVQVVADILNDKEINFTGFYGLLTEEKAAKLPEAAGFRQLLQKRAALDTASADYQNNLLILNRQIQESLARLQENDFIGKAIVWARHLLENQPDMLVILGKRELTAEERAKLKANLKSSLDDMHRLKDFDGLKKLYGRTEAFDIANPDDAGILQAWHRFKSTYKLNYAELSNFINLVAESKENVEKLIEWIKQGRVTDKVPPLDIANNFQDAGILIGIFKGMKGDPKQTLQNAVNMLQALKKNKQDADMIARLRGVSVKEQQIAKRVQGLEAGKRLGVQYEPISPISGALAFLLSVSGKPGASAKPEDLANNLTDMLLYFERVHQFMTAQAKDEDLNKLVEYADRMKTLLAKMGEKDWAGGKRPVPLMISFFMGLAKDYKKAVEQAKRDPNKKTLTAEEESALMAALSNKKLAELPAVYAFIDKLTEAQAKEMYQLLPKFFTNLKLGLSGEDLIAQILGWISSTAQKTDDPARALSSLKNAAELAEELNNSTEQGKKLDDYKNRFLSVMKFLMGMEKGEEFDADDAASNIVGSVMAAANDGKDRDGLLKDLEYAELFIAGAKPGDVVGLDTILGDVLDVFDVKIPDDERVATLMGMAIANGKEGRNLSKTLNMLKSAQRKLLDPKRGGFADKQQALKMAKDLRAIMTKIQPGFKESEFISVLSGSVMSVEQKRLSYSEHAAAVAKTRAFVEKVTVEQLAALKTEFFGMLGNLGETVATDKQQSQFFGYLFGTAEAVTDPAVALENLKAANKLAASLKASQVANQTLAAYKTGFLTLAMTLMGAEEAAKLTADDKISLIVGSVMATAKDKKDVAGLFKDLDAAKKFVAEAKPGDFERLYEEVSKILGVFDVPVKEKEKVSMLMGLAIANGRVGRTATQALELLVSANQRLMNPKRGGFKDKAQAAEFRDNFYAIMRLVEPGVDPAENSAGLLGAVQAIEQKKLNYGEEAVTVAKTKTFVELATPAQLAALRTEYFALLEILGEPAATDKQQSQFLGYLFATAEAVTDPAVALENLKAANNLAASLKASQVENQTLDAYKSGFLTLAKQLMGTEAAAKLKADDELSLIVGSLMAAARDGKDAAGLFKDLDAAKKFVAEAKPVDFEKLYAAVSKILGRNCRLDVNFNC